MDRFRADGDPGVFAYQYFFDDYDEGVASLRPFNIDRTADGVGLRRIAVEAGCSRESLYRPAS